MSESRWEGVGDLQSRHYPRETLWVSVSLRYGHQEPCFSLLREPQVSQH